MNINEIIDQVWGMDEASICNDGTARKIVLFIENQQKEIDKLYERVSDTEDALTGAIDEIVILTNNLKKEKL